MLVKEIAISGCRDKQKIAQSEKIYYTSVKYQYMTDID